MEQVELTIDDKRVKAEAGTKILQAALDAAGQYEIIEVADGVYGGEGNRDLSFLGKRLVLLSASGAAGCIINCDGGGRGFDFSSGEDERSVLRGFTVIFGKSVVMTPTLPVQVSSPLSTVT